MVCDKVVCDKVVGERRMMLTKLCVKDRRRRREEEAGGARDTESKTRTPHKVVGKNIGKTHLPDPDPDPFVSVKFRGCEDV